MLTSQKFHLATGSNIFFIDATLPLILEKETLVWRLRLVATRDLKDVAVYVV